MELAVRETYGPWQTSSTLPWQIEPTSNAVSSITQKTFEPGGTEAFVGGNIFLYGLRKQWISFAFELNELTGTLSGNIINNALFNALKVEGRATTAPQQISLTWVPPLLKTKHAARRLAQNATAHSLLATIQSRSGLTLEEIAPLLGVSRRSLQHWRAHGRISARKEQRLRDLADTLGSLPASETNEMRRKLLDRISDGVRAYDLLAEGRFDSAYSMITGLPAPAHLVARFIMPSTPSVPSLMDQLSRSR